MEVERRVRLKADTTEVLRDDPDVVDADVVDDPPPTGAATPGTTQDLPEEEQTSGPITNPPAPAEPVATEPPAATAPRCSFYADPDRRIDCTNEASVHITYKREPGEWMYPSEARNPGSEDVCEPHFKEHFEGPHTQLAWTDIESVQRPSSGTAPEAHHHHNHHDAGADIASVHPIRRDTTMTSTLNLSAGETLDPHAAKALADQLKDIATQCVSTVEQSSSSLTGAGVAGLPIELLGRLQEAFSIAASACEEIGGEFVRHQGIQDQVLSDSSLAGTVSDGYLGRA